MAEESVLLGLERHDASVDVAADDTKTLSDILQHRASSDPDRVGFSFLTYRGADTPQTDDLTYAELAVRASAFAAVAQQVVAPGDRILILCPPGLAYISTFFGCQLAGAVAIPAYPPRNSRHMGRLSNMLADAGAKGVATTTEYGGRIRDWAEAASFDTSVMLVDRIDVSEASRFHPANTGADDLAFLQYTSGTTGSPKGVMVRQRNVLANLAAIHSFVAADAGDRGVSWMPPFHDMGLIGTILYPVFAGFRVDLMNPNAFLKRPARWLEAMAASRATLASAPTFGWRLCAQERVVSQSRGLDLSSIRHAQVGAERIQVDVLRTFASRYAGTGFNSLAFAPVYGLAESVLLVTGAKDREPQARPVGCNPNTVKDPVEEESTSLGKVFPGHDLRIVDPESLQPLADGKQGEIWLRGPSVAGGYWNKVEASETVFHACLAGQAASGYWLRTGDLGSIVDGELHVAGRLKDVIIIRGANHHAQDLEATVEEVDTSFGHDRTVAVALQCGGAEHLIVIHELTRDAVRTMDMEGAAGSVRAALAEFHEIELAAMAFISPTTMPRTSSGKLRRSAARDAFANRQLEYVHLKDFSGVIMNELSLSSATEQQVEPVEAPIVETRSDPVLLDRLKAVSEDLWAREIESFLQLDLSKTLQLSVLPEGDANIFDLGMSSMSTLEVAGRLEEALGYAVEVSYTEFFDHPQLDTFAAHLAERLKARDATSKSTQVRPRILRPAKSGPVAAPNVQPIDPMRVFNNEYFRISRQTPSIHMFFEADVTDTLEAIREWERKFGKPLSITAYISWCLAQVVAEEPLLNTYRNRRRYVTFDDVDVLGLFEKVMPDGMRAPAVHVFRSAERTEFATMNDEANEVLSSPVTSNSEELRKLGKLPTPLLRMIFGKLTSDAHTMKEKMGTVFVSNLGMYRQSAPYFGLPVAYHTTGITVGAIYDGVRVINGAVKPRKIMCLTGTGNHDVVDGALGSRLATRMADILESGAGLDV